MPVKFILPIIAIVLQGCVLVGNPIPDETRVVDGPSLSIPPDFELKPPSKLEKREYNYNAAEKAKGVLLGAKAVKNQSTNEDWLVEKAGTADSDIRAQLEAEQAAKEKIKGSGWFNNMWGGEDTSITEKD